MRKLAICLLMALGCALTPSGPSEPPTGGASPSTPTDAPAASEGQPAASENLWLIRFHDYGRGSARAGVQSDFQHALSSRGHQNWRLAEQLILRRLRALYRGHPIEFARERRRPDAVYPKAGWRLARTKAVPASIITLQYSPIDGLLGCAIMDSGNRHREGNYGQFHFETPRGHVEIRLGVMVNQVIKASEEVWGRNFEASCRTIALVLAHEIGHSVGLNHCDAKTHTDPGDIMLPYHRKAPSYDFCEESRGVLRIGLNREKGVVQYSRLSLSRCGGGFLLSRRPVGTSAAPPATLERERRFR
jgi:hypothetical protein